MSEVFEFKLNMNSRQTYDQHLNGIQAQRPTYSNLPPSKI